MFDSSPNAHALRRRKLISRLAAALCFNISLFGALPTLSSSLSGQVDQNLPASKLDMDGQELTKPRYAESAGPNLRRKFDDIWREVERLKEAGEMQAAGKLATRLDRFVQQANDKLAPLPNEKAELHLVGVYEGAVENEANNAEKHPQGNAEVYVSFQAQPIVLALCAYEPVKWRIRLAEGVKLKRVILAGYYQQECDGLPPGVLVSNHSGQGSRRRFYVYRKDHENYPEAIQQLKEMTGLSVATMQGRYRYQGAAFVIGEENQPWKQELLAHRLAPLHREANAFALAQKRKSMEAIRFQAIYATPDGGRLPHLQERSLGVFTPAGPIASTLRSLPDVQHVAVDSKKQEHYGIARHSVVQFDLKTGKVDTLAIPPNLPKLSWPCGLAFDAKRRRVLLTSHGGEGHMYAYDVDKKIWSLVGSMNNLHLQAFAYSTERDCFFGLAIANDSREAPTIYTFSPEGAIIHQATLPENVTLPRRSPFTSSQIVAAGGNAVVIAPPAPVARDGNVTVKAKCYVVNPVSGRVLHEDLLQPHPGTTDFQPSELAKLWQDLLTDDEERADIVTWQLAAGGAKAVNFLNDKFAPLPKSNNLQIQRLIAQLDDDQIQNRDAAYQELATLGDRASSALLRAAKQPASAEQRMRIAKLLRALDRLEPPTPEKRRELRAVQALGRTQAKEANDLLKQLAEEQPSGMRSRLAAKALALKTEVD